MSQLSRGHLIAKVGLGMQAAIYINRALSEIKEGGSIKTALKMVLKEEFGAGNFDVRFNTYWAILQAVYGDKADKGVYLFQEGEANALI